MREEVTSLSESPYEKIDNTSFSIDMMRILDQLSHEDLSFIMLKYQENYSDNELADYYNISLEEVKQKEKAILLFLKNNYNGKTLTK